MNRAKMAALVVSLTLAACSGGGGSDGSSGGTTDYSGNFVGRWDGSSTLTLDGQSTPSPGTYTRITRVGDNSVNVADICGDETGPNAQVTSATAFRMSGKTCPPAAVSGCSSVSFVLDAGGTGDLMNGQLAMSITGSVTGCGLSFPLSMTFIGSRTSTNPAALMAEGEANAAAVVAEGETIGAAIAAELARHF